MNNQRTVIVTGAGRKTGLGYEVCKQLGEYGYNVVLTARDREDASARARELRELGLTVEGHGIAVTKACIESSLVTSRP